MTRRLVIAFVAFAASCKSSSDSDKSIDPTIEATPSGEHVTLFDKSPRDSLVLANGTLTARIAGSSAELVWNSEVIGSCAIDSRGRPAIATHKGRHVYVLCAEGEGVVVTRFVVRDSSLRHAGWAMASSTLGLEAIEGLEFSAPVEPGSDPAAQALAWLDSVAKNSSEAAGRSAFPLIIRAQALKPPCPSAADTASFEADTRECLTESLVPPGHRSWRLRRETITSLVRLLEDQDGDLVRLVSRGDGVRVDIDIIVSEERVSALAYRVELVE